MSTPNKKQRKSSKAKKDDQAIDPYASLSSGARRQMVKFCAVIGGKKNKIMVRRKVLEWATQIVLDSKGKFDVMTSAALRQIQKNGGSVWCEDAGEYIPASFKEEQSVTFKKAFFELDIRGNCLKINAIVIEKSIAAVILCGTSRDWLVTLIACSQKMKGSERTKTRDVCTPLKTWMEEDRKEKDWPVYQASDSSESGSDEST